MRSLWGAAAFFEDWLGTGPTAVTVATLMVLGAAALLFLALHRLVLPIAAHLAGHTAFRWDDIVVDARFRRWSAAVLTLVAVRRAESLVPGLSDFWSEFWIRVAGGLAIVAGTLAVSAFLMALNSVYETHPLATERPIKGYLQVVQIVAYTFGDIWVVAVLTDQTPWYLLSGLGAAAAVLLILYREPILSLSASMQLAQNDMVRVGDWIEMPEYGANGSVVDMALATVKVQNWDNTITSVPTHRLTSGSFKNWRGMAESGARRIRFPILLDTSTIRFLDGPQDADGATNVDALKRDLVAYLRRHPAVESRTMPVMVRQLAPTVDGLPIELYAFCRETDWQVYEAIKGEIIGYCLATLDRFGLRVFQHPTDAALRQTLSPRVDHQAPLVRETVPSRPPGGSAVGVMPAPTAAADGGAMTHGDASQRRFRIWIDGRLSERFADGLVGVEQRDEKGGTILSGDHVDDAHLQGVLDQLRGLGISIRRLEVAEDDDFTTSTTEIENTIADAGTANTTEEETMTSTMHVEELEYFGKPVDEFPKEAEREQARIFLRGLRERYGTLGLPRLFVDALVARRRFKRRESETLRRLEAEIGPGIVKETLVLVAMFEAIAAREGRENAYAVLRPMVERTGTCSLRAMYQIDDLTRCDGDVFENFKRFHLAMFDADVTQQLYPNTQTDAGDHFATTVHRCANVDIFTELGYPELGPFGCDHDLGGYAAITDEVQAEFRRPCTIAKGSDRCAFRFYRAGTAPDTELIDGVPVEWHAGLNR